MAGRARGGVDTRTYHGLRERALEEVGEADKPLIVVCSGGIGSSVVSSLIKRKT